MTISATFTGSSGKDSVRAPNNIGNIQAVEFLINPVAIPGDFMYYECNNEEMGFTVVCGCARAQKGARASLSGDSSIKERYYI